MFQQLAFREIQFKYACEDGFALGPLTLRIHAGEILFIAGGNGSGKTTLMKLLCDLYAPSAGIVSIDQKVVNMARHRDLFAAVFNDVHLFDALYGLETVEPHQVQTLLIQMDLAQHIRLEGTRFSHQKLSAGQQKRLALIIAMLEDKPVYIFDEWAAGQDPRFRRYFYEELLPALRTRGKTILAATHDDRYYAVADRVLTMQYGQIIEGIS